MEATHHGSAGGRDTLSVFGARLRRLFPAQETRPFGQLLMEIDEADWQLRLSRITLRCV